MPTSERESSPLFISVILPVYNACRTNSRYLIEALESVRSQTYKKLELIIVNDGSIDNSEKACQDFISRNPELNIRYYMKENGGQSSARNFGAKMARGTYLCFIDQDDIWIEKKLETLRPYLDSGLDLVYTDGDVIEEDGSARMAGIHRNYHCGSPHPQESIDAILSKDIFVMPGLTAIKKETFFRVNGFDEALSGYEDDDLFLRIFEIGKIIYIPISTLKWRMHKNNYSQSFRMVKSRLHYCHKLLDRYTDGGKDIRRTKRISYRFFWEFISQAIFQYQDHNELYIENLRGAQEIAPFLPSWEKTAFNYFFSLDDPHVMRKLALYYSFRKKLTPKTFLGGSLFRLKHLVYNRCLTGLKNFYLKITDIKDHG